eukprot:g2631.t1
MADRSVETALASLSVVELYELVAQMKDLVQCNPEQARSILLGHPQLAQALLQAQVMLGMMNSASFDMGQANATGAGAAPADAGGQGVTSAAQEALLRQVRQMTPETIAALPPEQQQQVKLLKQQLEKL